MYFIVPSFKKWSFFLSSHFIFHRLFWRGHWTPFVKIQIKHSNSDQSITKNPKSTTPIPESHFVFSGDVREDGMIEGYPIATFFFPLAFISLLPEVNTVCITGTGFQQVQIRMSVFDFIRTAKKIEALTHGGEVK